MDNNEISLERLAEILHKKETDYDVLKKNAAAFEGLHKYIEKNVSDDRKANVKRLEQLKRNLHGWQTKLIKMRDEKPYEAKQLNLEYKVAVLQLEAVVQSALKDIDYRINSNDMSAPKEYNDYYTIITLSDRALNFIKEEFNKQAQENLPVTKIYRGNEHYDEVKNEMKYTFYHYFFIRSEVAPLFDLDKFKDAVRYLMLHVDHQRLEKVLNPVFNLATSILKIYDEDLSPLEDLISEKEESDNLYKSKLLMFHKGAQKIGGKLVEAEELKRYKEDLDCHTNLCLAAYAQGIAMFLSEEVLNIDNKENSKKLIENTIPVGITYNTEETTSERMTFAELFDPTSLYHKTLKLLAEKQFIDPHSNHWKDRSSGALKTFVAIMRKFESKGYFKKGVKITGRLLKPVALNTFNLDISESLINHTKEGQVLGFDFEFIVPPSTLQ